VAVTILVSNIQTFSQYYDYFTISINGGGYIHVNTNIGREQHNKTWFNVVAL
jgi:hypothetical protein